MVRQLIRFDDKHISVDQMKMSIDRVLQYFIHNLPGLPSLLIEIYLREAGFWHMANIGQRCKLDLKLISAFVERWRPETHTLHLPCGEHTITSEDMQLQLRLSVDRSILTKFAQSADRGAICYDLLGVISNIIYGGRIVIGWLPKTFPVPGDDSIEVQRVRYAWAYILQIIRVTLEVSMMSTKLTYDDQIRIGLSSTRNILKCGKISTIIYLLENQLSFHS
ncbi:hypothetical protein Golob_004386 [Gossypium lobatum]|uniref:Aminotransferase-like plant mobile domain-containing protein n=1 Tax=Gossypium lobatum TaxID=34289 RepID=A0A7J8N1I2_9ROSI|nr:hypothetical protein [Gossypium lobatum]